MQSSLQPISATAVVCVTFVVFASGAVVAEECQNQAVIDTCRALCSATSDTCGALCDVASGACWVGCQAAFGTCDAGCEACDLGCEACCCDICVLCDCGDCRDACDDCRADCNSARSSCESGCQLECDNCILECEAGCPNCIPFRTVGEPCIPVVDRCADGLVCWPLPLPGDDTTRCFPSEGDRVFPEEECLALYSSAVHQAAIDIGDALTFGRGSGLAAVVGATFELGVLYGEDGRFGCYGTTCVGAQTNVSIDTYVAAGLYRTYGDVPGQSIAIVEGAGEIISFSTSQILNTDGELIGTADYLALEASLLPVAVGVYDCATIVDTIGVRDDQTGELIPIANQPPVARCTDVELCADPDTCVADASIDDGSFDPDMESVILTQDPPGPYGPGTTVVTLTAADPGQEFDTCTALATVVDCSGPTVTEITASPSTLWPPNKRMRRVELSVAAADSCGGDVICVIVDVETDEPNGRRKGSGDGARDMNILDDLVVELRADRAGNGDGRTYTITVECADGAGNTSQAQAAVSVPHDQRNNKR